MASRASSRGCTTAGSRFNFAIWQETGGKRERERLFLLSRYYHNMHINVYFDKSLRILCVIFVISIINNTKVAHITYNAFLCNC